MRSSQEPDERSFGNPADIKTVIAWENGTVMCFDSAGRQIAEYEGWLSENCERILRDAREDVRLLMGDWREKSAITITPAMFRSLAEAEAIPDGRH